MEIINSLGNTLSVKQKLMWNVKRGSTQHIIFLLNPEYIPKMSLILGGLKLFTIFTRSMSVSGFQVNLHSTLGQGCCVGVGKKISHNLLTRLNEIIVKLIYSVKVIVSCDARCGLLWFIKFQAALQGLAASRIMGFVH